LTWPNRLVRCYYPGNQDPHKSLQPIRSSNSRSRLPGDQRSTTESTKIHGKENPNQLPLSVSLPGATPARRVGSFRGYPFVMIFLAGVILSSLSRPWSRASGVSRSGPDSVRAAPESPRRRAAGLYAHARGGLSTPSLMALVNRRRQLGAICSNGATCTRSSSRPLRVRGWNIWSVTSMPLKTKHLFTAHTSCVPVSSPRPRFQSSCVPVSSLPFPVPSCVPVSSPIYLAQPTQSVEQERANFPDLVLASPKRPSFQALGSAGLARVVRTIDLVVSGVFG
jgi:hypothetical protein